MTPCEVGLFRMPGISFKNKNISTDLQDKIEDWTKHNNCGIKLTEYLWSFKTDKQREWFILRWSDEINKELSE